MQFRISFARSSSCFIHSIIFQDVSIQLHNPDSYYRYICFSTNFRIDFEQIKKYNISTIFSVKILTSNSPKIENETKCHNCLHFVIIARQDVLKIIECIKIRFLHVIVQMTKSTFFTHCMSEHENLIIFIQSCACLWVNFNSNFSQLV